MSDKFIRELPEFSMKYVTKVGVKLPPELEYPHKEVLTEFLAEIERLYPGKERHLSLVQDWKSRKWFQLVEIKD